MPAPMPSMPASVGARPGTVVIVEAQSSSAKPKPTPAKATSSALPRRPQAAQDEEQQDDGHEQAGDLADREAAGRGAVEHLAGERRPGRPRVGTPSRSRAAPPRRCRGPRPARRSARPRPRCAPSGAVRVSTPTTCGWRSIAAHDLVDGAVAEVAGEHDRRLRARLGGEAGFEQVLCPLGLDARDGEVVFEAATGGDRARDERDDDEEDECGDAAGSATGSARRGRRACAAM